MRLTLRTLLAWLDDTLTPSEVREIGKQVEESPFARELVERIHKVTRQRRLAVPPKNGPEAVDPNVVAAYLDSELDADQVAELEKKCLTSDVHLAEVASVHQILSLIGQKAKVPVEARHRMYQLVKGREAVKPRMSRSSKHSEPEPVAQPVQPWVIPPTPPRSAIERFGPAAGVLALIGLMMWSAWMSLGPGDASNSPVQIVSRPDRETPPAEATQKPQPPAGNLPAMGPNPALAANESKPASPESTGEKPAEKPEKPEIIAPPGSIGLARKPAGVLLRYNPERREWERLISDAPLHEQDRLLSLAPFRATIELGKGEADLVGETEVWTSGSLPTEPLHINLVQGRLALTVPQGGAKFEIKAGTKSLLIEPPAGSTVGVERLPQRPQGEPAAAEPELRVFATVGPVKVGVGKESETLDSASAVTVTSAGTFANAGPRATPEWVTEKELPPFDKTVGEQFFKIVGTDRPIVTSLVEALEEEQPEICRLAISGLRAVGDISYIVPLLNKKGGPTGAVARKQAIAVLRAFLAQSPDSAQALKEQLINDLGPEIGETTNKLIVGYTPKEAQDEATYATLVRLLGSTEDSELGLRQLALENLKQLTGRDDLEYDPENPEGKALKAWRDLLRDKELKPAAAK